MILRSVFLSLFLSLAALVAACSGRADPDLGPPVDLGPPPDLGPDRGPDAGPLAMLLVGTGEREFREIADGERLPLKTSLINGGVERQYVELAVRATLFLPDLVFVDVSCTRARDGAEVCTGTRSREVDVGASNPAYSVEILDHHLLITVGDEPDVLNEDLDVRVELQEELGEGSGMFRTEVRHVTIGISDTILPLPTSDD